MVYCGLVVVFASHCVPLAQTVSTKLGTSHGIFIGQNLTAPHSWKDSTMPRVAKAALLLRGSGILIGVGLLRQGSSREQADDLESSPVTSAYASVSNRRSTPSFGGCARRCGCVVARQEQKQPLLSRHFCLPSPALPGRRNDWRQLPKSGRLAVFNDLEQRDPFHL